MVKRKTTRKKAAKPARKKAQTSGAIRRSPKKTRKLTPTAGKAAKKKTTRKKAVTAKKSKKTANATIGKKASRKKTVKRATNKKVSAKAARKQSRKKQVAKKQASPQKRTRKASKAAVATTRSETPAVKPEPPEPGLPLKEVRARLGLIGPQIADLDWLEGLYLYGAALLEVPRLERVAFIVVYRGRHGAKRLKAAESELRTLLEAVLPLDFELNTGTLEVGRLLNEGNPAAMAHLGYAEPIFTRSV